MHSCFITHVQDWLNADLELFNGFHVLFVPRNVARMVKVEEMQQQREHILASDVQQPSVCRWSLTQLAGRIHRINSCQLAGASEFGTSMIVWSTPVAATKPLYIIIIISMDLS